MKLRAIVTVLAGVCLTISSAGAQQMTIEQAREEGKAFGNAKRGDESLVPSSEAQAQAVPGYSGTNQPQSTYFDDPDALIAAGTAQRSTNESYRTVTDADRTRPAFSNAEILATTSRATSIENDPSAYLADENIGSTTGQCQPLPPGSGAGGYYEATCNQGTKLDEVPRSCSIRMAPEITKIDAYKYFVVPDSAYGTPFARYSSMAPHVAAGTCKPTGVAMQACAAHRIYGVSTNKFCDDYYATEYVCSQNLRDIALLPSPITGEGWHEKTVQTSVTVKRVDGCAEMAADAMCTAAAAGEVCTEGPETRIIDGVPVTQACWAWKRDFTCNVMSAGNDCGDLDANRQCTFLREDCLDDPQQGACKVKEKVYRCTTPDTPTSNAPQYICGDDVYCINGDCEPITREASTEFKDALVALHAIDDASKGFDPNNLTVFSGTRDTCHKPVFGLINCCAGKVSGALTVAAGGAALAGGPVAIAALATPFLALFACSQDEMKLDIKDRMGFCHKVGTWCSSSFLGICKTKKTAYCCFESKLSRVLQEQGRVQLNKPWGKPKNEQCKGFSIAEFQRLDLSKMDFTEVYADFLDAAKLPDEVQTMTEIQSKIQNYYDLHGGKP
ncbi:conjugal transfer protein TraN [Sphingomonas koreensis]|uniref:Conjugal transfer protein TraN n=4 Tax=Pseudomonadota TaxID=1224 RepID=A0A1L6JIQ5_9SPHN|nr:MULTISPECIES: conjugal transfer protein TraN [Sphingomonadaceae]APR55370.1 conjugal transfer protein TraN [Sphingomonas koreensis]OJU23383.1 MAG: conjugal transfer protein TraN [Sphingomonas sp. 66-10]RSU17649.1 conjugal transfer protein TraN [Sphingomonas koreensis]RSU20118.1 conjugal transfer protein TraN [Sphingomonas koreensis]RSU22321.1 conjugal transfer protein TraN [Sphingomonas koreensis]